MCVCGRGCQADRTQRTGREMCKELSLFVSFECHFGQPGCVSHKTRFFHFAPEQPSGRLFHRPTWSHVSTLTRFISYVRVHKKQTDCYLVGSVVKSGKNFLLSFFSLGIIQERGFSLRIIFQFLHSHQEGQISCKFFLFIRFWSSINFWRDSRAFEQSNWPNADQLEHPLDNLFTLGHLVICTYFTRCSYDFFTYITAWTTSRTIGAHCVTVAPLLSLLLPSQFLRIHTQTGTEPAIPTRCIHNLSLSLSLSCILP